MIIYGINPILEALRAGRVKGLRIGAHPGRRVEPLLQQARRDGIPVRKVSPADLDRVSRGGVHQGIVAEVADLERVEVADLAADASRPPLVVVLDGIEDPHNVGAILRTADAAGVSGVVRQSRRAAPLDGVAAKASAGAVSTVRVVDVVNIARALDELKAAGMWVVGLAGEASKVYDELDLTGPTAIVVGAEGAGLRRLVRERCDWLVSIPMKGQVRSLNVSVAAAIVLFEAVRQRTKGNR
jgi:23S rRNA (guanosine2251-2'-O)-methyltransferase